MAIAILLIPESKFAYFFSLFFIKHYETIHILKLISFL